MRDNMYRAETFLRGPLDEVKEMHLCVFFYSTAFSHYIAGHFMSSTWNLLWIICLSIFNTKSTSKCMLSILHLLKSLYKHIQSLNVFLSLWMKYMKNANDEKISESFGIWKKNSKVCRQSFVELTRFLVRFL